MQKYVAVEIEHSRYAKFLRVDEKDRRGLNLTTLVDNQRKAEVHIYLVGEGKRHLLHSFIVTNLPRQRAGEPRLYLSGQSDGRGGVQLSLKVNGKPWSSTDLSLKKYLSRRRPLLIAGLGLLLLLFLLGLILRSCLPAPEGQKRGQTEADVRAPVEETAETAITEEAESTDETGAEADGVADPVDGTGTGTDTGLETATGAGADDEPSAGEQDAEEADRKAAEGADREPAAPPPEAETVYFGPNSSLLTRSARDRLSSLSEELTGYRQLRILIRGHCALYGTEQGRIELSNERANTVEQYLLERAGALGIDPSGWRIDSAGLGGKEPETRDEERQNLNRRVEIRIERR